MVILWHEDQKDRRSGSIPGTPAVERMGPLQDAIQLNAIYVKLVFIRYYKIM